MFMAAVDEFSGLFAAVRALTLSACMLDFRFEDPLPEIRSTGIKQTKKFVDSLYKLRDVKTPFGLELIVQVSKVNHDFRNAFLKSTAFDENYCCLRRYTDVVIPTPAYFEVGFLIE
ncbi:hypothetical protein AVEN_55342-1 [Araneus ventricosus]|uniref:Uncharacterized protein n=1 Tax=Araneus ventricosus TaxID=182803 RepID=A0A4Y2DDP6_ARAVE|nr:hypothetical protein AVEN_55342-1 [Araneus ventricosus]